MMSASYVQVELKNDNDANVWFRFCYESKESNASVDIHEAVIPKQYRRVYIKIPTGAVALGWITGYKRKRPGKSEEFKDARWIDIVPPLARPRSFNFDENPIAVEPLDFQIEMQPSFVTDSLMPSVSTITPRQRHDSIERENPSFQFMKYSPRQLNTHISEGVIPISSMTPADLSPDHHRERARKEDINIQCKDINLYVMGTNVESWLKSYFPREAIRLCPSVTVRAVLIAQGFEIKLQINERVRRASSGDNISYEDQDNNDVAPLPPQRKHPSSPRARKTFEERIKTEMSPMPKTLSHVERIKDKIDKLKHMKSRRSMVCKEILDVEEKYVNSMHRLATCRKDMMTSFQENSELDIDAIFGNVDVIVGLNDILLDNLRRSNETENNDTIGKIFMKFAPFLKLYSVYLKHLEDSMSLVTKYSEDNVSFKSHCDALEEPLSSMLIRPVQQIPRYVMLLKELLKYTSESHPDRKNIQHAAQLCSQVASYCNEKLERKRLEILAENVRDRFRGQGLVRNDIRHVLKEQSLIKVNRHGNDQERVFVLFNDALAYGVGTPKEDVDLHKVYYMGEFGVFKVKDANESFEVRCHTEKGTARIFTVRTQSEKCRDEWLSDILNAMKIAGKDSCQDKFWGEDFWGERFSWEKKDTQLGNPEMWEIAAKMFSQPPFSNGHDARYTKVKTRLRKLYGRKAINESNKLRLKALALNHGIEGVLGPQVVVQKRVRKSILGFKFRGSSIQNENGKVENNTGDDNLPEGLKSKLSGKKFGRRGSFFGNLFSSFKEDLPERDTRSSSTSSSSQQGQQQSPQKNRKPMSAKAAKLLGMMSQRGSPSGAPGVDRATHDENLLKEENTSDFTFMATAGHHTSNDSI